MSNPSKVGAGGTSVTGMAGRVDALNREDEARTKAANTWAQAKSTANTFRVVTLVLALAFLPQSCIVMWALSSGVRDHVVILKVDSLGNEVILDPAPKEPLTPDANVIHGILQQWIENVRWITNDKRMFTFNWDKIETFSTQAAMRQLDLFRKEQQARQEGGRRVQVTVTQVLKQPNTRTYLVNWREEAYDLMGTLIVEESCLCSAALEVADFQGTLAKQELDLRRTRKDFRNRFGVFVNGVKWTASPLPPPTPAERKQS